MAYPTVPDAEAAGYHLIGGFRPGSGAHYIRFGGSSGAFDAAQAPTLIYAGTKPESPVVGLMHLGNGETSPERFAGPNDHWHRHSNVCVNFGPSVLA